MKSVSLYGPAWSAYVRTARLALIEKGVDYELIEVDFSSGKMPATQLERQPFGKVPVLDHEGFQIYETTAINRYVDAAFAGPALQPTEPKRLGRMAQIVAILDAYISEEVRMGVVNEGLIKPMMRIDADQERLEQAFATVATRLGVLSDCTISGEFLAGHTITLADLHAVPLFDYLEMTPGGADLIASQPILKDWWTRIASRPSIVMTTPDLSTFTSPKR